MSRSQSPEQVGETIALDEWQCRGRALVTLHSTYARAVYRLEKECQAPHPAAEAFEDSEVEEEAFMNVIEEVGDLLVAIKRHAEMLPPAARREFFVSLETFGAKSPISSRTFERLEEELNEYAADGGGRMIAEVSIQIKAVFEAMEDAEQFEELSGLFCLSCRADQWLGVGRVSISRQTSLASAAMSA